MGFARHTGERYEIRFENIKTQARTNYVYES